MVLRRMQGLVSRPPLPATVDCLYIPRQAQGSMIPPPSMMDGTLIVQSCILLMGVITASGISGRQKSCHAQGTAFHKDPFSKEVRRAAHCVFWHKQGKEGSNGALLCLVCVSWRGRHCPHKDDSARIHLYVIILNGRRKCMTCDGSVGGQGLHSPAQDWNLRSYLRAQRKHCSLFLSIRLCVWILSLFILG